MRDATIPHDVLVQRKGNINYITEVGSWMFKQCGRSNLREELHEDFDSMWKTYMKMNK